MYERLHSLTDTLIQERIADEISSAMEGINGPSVYPSDITVDRSDPEQFKITVTLPLHFVPEDDYIGLCTY